MILMPSGTGQATGAVAVSGASQVASAVAVSGASQVTSAVAMSVVVVGGPLMGSHTSHDCL